MKKIFVIALVVMLVVAFSGMAFGQPPTKIQTFNLSATVQKYIQVNPAYVNPPWSITIPGHGTGVLGNLKTRPYVDAVYSNSRFKISYTGSAGGVSGPIAFPILSRLEIPTGNGYDRLQTGIRVVNTINGVAYHPAIDNEVHGMSFYSNPNGAPTGTWTGQTLIFNNAPHDGEVQVLLMFNAALPHVSPDFGPDNTWNQSADAGLYQCTLVATYATW